MSEMPEDVEIKLLLRAALPDAAATSPLSLDVVLARAGKAASGNSAPRFGALVLAYCLIALCTGMIVACLVAERHYADLLHEALLKLPAE